MYATKSCIFTVHVSCLLRYLQETWTVNIHTYILTLTITHTHRKHSHTPTQYTHTHTNTCTHMHACIHIHTHRHTNIYSCPHVPKHMCTHRHTHTHTHVYTLKHAHAGIGGELTWDHHDLTRCLLKFQVIFDASRHSKLLLQEKEDYQSYLIHQCIKLYILLSTSFKFQEL